MLSFISNHIAKQSTLSLHKYQCQNIEILFKENIDVHLVLIILNVKFVKMIIPNFHFFFGKLKFR